MACSPSPSPPCSGIYWPGITEQVVKTLGLALVVIFGSAMDIAAIQQDLRTVVGGRRSGRAGKGGSPLPPPGLLDLPGVSSRWVNFQNEPNIVNTIEAVCEETLLVRPVDGQVLAVVPAALAGPPPPGPHACAACAPPPQKVDFNREMVTVAVSNMATGAAGCGYTGSYIFRRAPAAAWGACLPARVA